MNPSNRPKVLAEMAETTQKRNGRMMLDVMIQNKQNQLASSLVLPHVLSAANCLP
jgi:hypothetical protein